MFRRNILPILGLLLAIVAFIVSIIVLPILLGGWAILCLIAASIAMVSFIIVIIGVNMAVPGLWMHSARIVATSCLGVFLLVLFVWGSINLSRSFAATQFKNTDVVVVETTAPTETIALAETVSTESPALAANTTTSAIAIPESDPFLDHGTYPQTQIGHPNFYVETDTNSTYKWTFEVKEKEIGIVGGVVVDGKGGGVYRAYTPGTYTVTVSNGFVLTTQKEWAQNEFEFRIGQAVQYNWAHGTVDYGPLTKPAVAAK